MSHQVLEAEDSLDESEDTTVTHTLFRIDGRTLVFNPNTSWSDIEKQLAGALETKVPYSGGRIRRKESSSTVPYVDSKDAVVFFEGERIEANYKNEGRWYIGCISKVYDDFTYDIAYDAKGFALCDSLCIKKCKNLTSTTLSSFYQFDNKLEILNCEFNIIQLNSNTRLRRIEDASLPYGLITFKNLESNETFIGALQDDNKTIFSVDDDRFLKEKAREFKDKKLKDTKVFRRSIVFGINNNRIKNKLTWQECMDRYYELQELDSTGDLPESRDEVFLHLGVLVFDKKLTSFKEICISSEESGTSRDNKKELVAIYFPDPYLKFDMLEHLDLSKNNLSVVPLGIYEIRSLNSLKLSHNKITEIHENVGNLALLKTLHIDFNRLNRRLPYSMLKLLKLTDFKASKASDLQFIAEEIQKWTNFEQIENGMLKWAPNPLMKIKIPVFVIGISSSGKSFIADFLRNKFEECVDLYGNCVLVWDILSFSTIDAVYDCFIANAIYVVTYDIGSSSRDEDFNLKLSLQKSKLLEDKIASVSCLIGLKERIVRVATYKNQLLYQSNKDDPEVIAIFQDQKEKIFVSVVATVSSDVYESEGMFSRSNSLAAFPSFGGGPLSRSNSGALFGNSRSASRNFTDGFVSNLKSPLDLLWDEVYQKVPIIWKETDKQFTFATTIKSDETDAVALVEKSIIGLYKNFATEYQTKLNEQATPSASRSTSVDPLQSTACSDDFEGGLDFDKDGESFNGRSRQNSNDKLEIGRDKSKAGDSPTIEEYGNETEESPCLSPLKVRIPERGEDSQSPLEPTSSGGYSGHLTPKHRLFITCRELFREIGKSVDDYEHLLEVFLAVRNLINSAVLMSFDVKTCIKTSANIGHIHDQRQKEMLSHRSDCFFFTDFQANNSNGNSNSSSNSFSRSNSNSSLGNANDPNMINCWQVGVIDEIDNDRGFCKVSVASVTHNVRINYMQTVDSFLNSILIVDMVWFNQLINQVTSSKKVNSVNLNSNNLNPTRRRNRASASSANMVYMWDDFLEVFAYKRVSRAKFARDLEILQALLTDKLQAICPINLSSDSYSNFSSLLSTRSGSGSFTVGGSRASSASLSSSLSSSLSLEQRQGFSSKKPIYYLIPAVIQGRGKVYPIIRKNYMSVERMMLLYSLVSKKEFFSKYLVRVIEKGCFLASSKTSSCPNIKTYFDGKIWRSSFQQFVDEVTINVELLPIEQLPQYYHNKYIINNFPRDKNVKFCLVISGFGHILQVSEILKRVELYHEMALQLAKELLRNRCTNKFDMSFVTCPICLLGSQNSRDSDSCNITMLPTRDFENHFFHSSKNESKFMHLVNNCRHKIMKEFVFSSDYKPTPHRIDKPSLQGAFISNYKSSRQNSGISSGVDSSEETPTSNRPIDPDNIDSTIKSYLCDLSNFKASGCPTSPLAIDVNYTRWESNRFSVTLTLSASDASKYEIDGGTLIRLNGDSNSSKLDSRLFEETVGGIKDKESNSYSDNRSAAIVDADADADTLSSRSFVVLTCVHLHIYEAMKHVKISMPFGDIGNIILDAPRDEFARKVVVKLRSRDRNVVFTRACMVACLLKPARLEGKNLKKEEESKFINLFFGKGNSPSSSSNNSTSLPDPGQISTISPSLVVPYSQTTSLIIGQVVKLYYFNRSDANNNCESSASRNSSSSSNSCGGGGGDGGRSSRSSSDASSPPVAEPNLLSAWARVVRINIREYCTTGLPLLVTITTDVRNLPSGLGVFDLQGRLVGVLVKSVYEESKVPVYYVRQLDLKFPDPQFIGDKEKRPAVADPLSSQDPGSQEP